MRRFSLQHKLLLALVLSVLAAVAAVGACLTLTESVPVGLLLGSVTGVATAALAFHLLFRHYFTRLDGLRTGLLNLLDGEFSVSLHHRHNDELGDLVPLFNKVSEKLRIERQTLYQRELMLDTVIQNSGLFLMLTDSRERIVYHSRNLGAFLGCGRSLVGSTCQAVAAEAPTGLSELLSARKDGVFDARHDGEARIYHLSVGRFVLNAQEHHLFMIKDMTKAMTRQEAQVWKKTIRVISHELNNTLAPISSMSHSGKLLLQKQRYDLLPDVLETIAERSEHLRVFVDQYAQVARLPPPNKQTTTWQELIGGITGTYPFTLAADLPIQAVELDKTQIQQVLLNLLKNAFEAGSAPEETEIHITHGGGEFYVQVLDRGCGMESTVLLNAIHPYFSTKTGGSGVGLPLCREIIEAHGGAFSIANRPRGGVAVRMGIPAR